MPGAVKLVPVSDFESAVFRVNNRKIDVEIPVFLLILFYKINDAFDDFFKLRIGMKLY